MGRKRKSKRRKSGGNQSVQEKASAPQNRPRDEEPPDEASGTDLAAEERALAEERRTLDAERSAFEQAKEDFGRHREQLGDQQAQLTDALAQAQQELEAKTKALEEEWHRRQQQLAVERERVHGELESQRAIIDAQKETLTSLNEGLESERKALQELRESLGEDRLVLEDLRVGLKEDRVAVAELREDLEKRIEEQESAASTEGESTKELASLRERVVGLEAELAEARATAREHESRLDEHARSAKEALETLARERDELREELERETTRAQDLEAALKGSEAEGDPFAETTREYARETQELPLPTPKMVAVSKDAPHPFDDEAFVEDTEPGRKIAATPFDDDDEETVDAPHPAGAGADVDAITAAAELPAKPQSKGTPFDQRETQAMRLPKLMWVRTLYYRHIAQIFVDGGDGAHAIRRRRTWVAGGIGLLVLVVGVAVWLGTRSGERAPSEAPAQSVVEAAMAQVPLKQLTRVQQAQASTGPSESSLRISREAIAIGVKKAKRAPLKACLKAAVERGEIEAGSHTLVMGWTVAADGKASLPVVQEPSALGSSETLACLEGAMARWKFPKSSGPSVVRNFPLGPLDAP